MQHVLFACHLSFLVEILEFSFMEFNPIGSIYVKVDIALNLETTKRLNSV